MDFYFWRYLDGIDADQVLDILVALSSDAFDRAQDTRIAGCRHHNSDERLIGRADAFDSLRLISAAVNRPKRVTPKNRSRISGSVHRARAKAAAHFRWRHRKARSGSPLIVISQRRRSAPCMVADS
jgi:hypothetical protein